MLPEAGAPRQNGANVPVKAWMTHLHHQAKRMFHIPRCKKLGTVTGQATHTQQSLETLAHVETPAMIRMNLFQEI